MKDLLHGCNWLRSRVNRHWREAHRKETFVQPCLQTRWVQAFKRLYRPVQPRQSKSEFHGSARANAEWMYSPSPKALPRESGPLGRLAQEWNRPPRGPRL